MKPLLARPMLGRAAVLVSLAGIAGGLWPGGLDAQTPGRLAELPDLTAAWEERVARGDLAGVVSLILQDGVILSADSAGWADVQRGRPMGLETRVRIASMTKPVTSVAAMMLVERGVLELDAPIARWLPTWADVRVLETPGGEPVPATGPMTVRHLLSHRAGITYGFLDRGPIGDAYRALGVRDLIGPDPETQGDNMARLVQAPLAFQPGARWRYGLSTDLLGHLVEVASGESLADFFAREIFAPLGMGATSFRVPDEAAADLAVLYTRGPEGGLVPVPGSDGLGSATFLSGGGGLISTALDYARFAEMLLRGGALEGVRILEEATVRTLLTSQTEDLDPSPLGPGRAFSLGLRLEQDGAFGWEGIYGTAFLVRPATRSVAILLLQQTPRNPEGIEEAFRAMAQTWVESALLPAPPSR